MSDELDPTEVGELRDLLNSARWKHEWGNVERIRACRPYDPSWDREAWNRDYPYLGPQDEYIARAVLESDWLKKRDAAKDQFIESVAPILEEVPGMMSTIEGEWGSGHSFDRLLTKGDKEALAVRRSQDLLAIVQGRKDAQ